MLRSLPSSPFVLRSPLRSSSVSPRPSQIRSASRRNHGEGPQEKIFALINDFHRWGNGSPSESKQGPRDEAQYSEHESGKGRGLAWDGKQECGPAEWRFWTRRWPSKIVIKLDVVTRSRATQYRPSSQCSAGRCTNVNG